MKRLLSLLLLLAAEQVDAWERVVTTAGETFEGDSSFEELVLTSSSSGEIVVPRAALAKIEAKGGALEVSIKDGSKVTGRLKEMLEIEDGMVRRRFSNDELQVVDFDLYINPSGRPAFSSCPIRFDLEPGSGLSTPGRAFNSSLSARVSCRDLRILTLRAELKQPGSGSTYRTAKPGRVVVDAMVQVPPGPMQIGEIAVSMIQNEEVVARNVLRSALPGGKNIPMQVTLNVLPGRLDPAAGPLRLRVQLVHQGNDQPIERGGFFWWFTIPLPF